MISFNYNDIDYQVVGTRLISRWVRRFIGDLYPNWKIGQISITFTSDQFMVKENIRHLNHHHKTDILTFDFSSDMTLEGQLLISVEWVEKNAEHFAHSFGEELLRVVIHGFLHLLGLDDSTEEEIAAMRDMENRALLHFKENFGLFEQVKVAQ